MPQILEIDLHIHLGYSSIWNRINDQGQIIEILMIQIPLHGNWIVITPKFISNNINIQFLSLMDALPPPTLISLEEHIPLMDQQDEEI